MAVAAAPEESEEAEAQVEVEVVRLKSSPVVEFRSMETFPRLVRTVSLLGAATDWMAQPGLQDPPATRALMGRTAVAAAKDRPPIQAMVDREAPQMEATGLMEVLEDLHLPRKQAAEAEAGPAAEAEPAAMVLAAAMAAEVAMADMAEAGPAVL